MPINREEKVASRGFANTSCHVLALKPHPDLPELRRLEEVEKQLARKYGIPEDPFTDPVAILQEAKNRAASSRGGTRTILRVLDGVVGRHNESASNIEDLENLQRLYHLRFKLTELQIDIKPNPHPVDDASRFWAVLIGIDAYKSNPLYKCVSDALLMKSFLTEDLRIPEKRIQCLLGSNDSTTYSSTPSRDNIVNTLRSLIDNPRIQWGDNIIIYFAGLGSSYCCSSTSGFKCPSCTYPIQSLCPIDRNIDSSGDLKLDISSRELNELFTLISRTKGHNITFIADCCHASPSFDHQARDSAMRFAALVPQSINDMLCTVDQRLKHLPCCRPVLDMSSHVILAACPDYHTAKETPVGKGGCVGHFTRTLVDVLTSRDWKKETTYVELVERLNDSYFQLSVVAGDRKNECLWYHDAGASS